MMKLLQTVLLLLCFTAYTTQVQAINAELYKILEDVSKELFHISAHELLEVIHQEVGPIALITAQDLSAKIAQNPNLVVVNVLSKNWYNDCHIPDSINIPLPELIYKVADWDRQQEIIVYCALDECDAGEKAFILLHCMGFTNVADFKGGIKEWFQSGFPVNGPCQASYLHNKEVSRTFDCLKIEISE